MQGIVESIATARERSDNKSADITRPKNNEKL
jgi:hypothetical protein